MRRGTTRCSPRKRALQLRIKLIESDGGQEAQAAQVHGKDRDLAAGHRARRGEQRSVAAQHDHQLRALGDLSRAAARPLLSEIARGLVVQPRFNAALVPPRDQFRHDGGRVRDARLRDDADHFNVWHVRGTPGCLPRPGSGTE